MGLADDIGSVDTVARDIIKVENIVDFTTHEGIADRLAKKFGAGVASAFPGFGAQAGGVTLR
jgi:protease-4